MSDTLASPEVIVRGPGEPDVAIVGGIHGDEPSGVRAVRRLLDSSLDLQRGVKFVIANPAAIEADERYLDSDLNRSFPGDPDGDYEHRLAARLCDVTGELLTLSLHATHSQPEPMALVHRSQPRAFELASRMPVPYVVDHSAVNDGTLTACGPVVTVEAGCQHTDEAADTAERQARAFLTLTGALSGAVPEADPDYFALRDPIRKPASDSRDYELLVENFDRVPSGTVFARADGDDLVADEPFYPILMSECGYANIFGYTGVKLGDTLAEARAALDIAVD